MASAILQSIKQGAYIAISLYVVFIAVVTVTSMSPSLTSPGFPAASSGLVNVEPAAANARS